MQSTSPLSKYSVSQSAADQRNPPSPDFTRLLPLGIMASLMSVPKELARLSSRSVGCTARGFSKSAVHSKQSYPLYPSVAQLLHEKGIQSSEVDKIPASGPKGRLLKGDVLAYLGSISSSYSSDQSARISKLAHLDLSNVQIAAPKDPKESPAPAISSQPAPELERDTEVAVSISLKAVVEVQQRIQAALGVTLPLSTFIARATNVANEDLPRSTTHKLSADELFDQVLGLDRVNSKTSQGSFTPQILALPSKPLSSTPGPAKKLDIIDILVAGRSSKETSKSLGVLPLGIMAESDAGATNVFSVSVPKGQEKRARVFLERVKTMLQVEPGSLVL